MFMSCEPWFISWIDESINCCFVIDVSAALNVVGIQSHREWVLPIKYTLYKGC